jgi:hypothetical protein
MDDKEARTVAQNRSRQYERREKKHSQQLLELQHPQKPSFATIDASPSPKKIRNHLSRSYGTQEHSREWRRVEDRHETHSKRQQLKETVRLVHVTASVSF